MPRVRPGYRGMYFEVKDEVAAMLEELADRHGRTASAELESAIRRHHATPPVIVSPEGPPLAPAEVVPETKTPLGRTPRRKKKPSPDQ